MDFATSQPAIFYNGAHGSAPGGSNIDSNSELLLGSLITRPTCKIDLFHRPFLTVPFLGRGSVDPILESQIQQGETLTSKKSVTRLPEKSYIIYQNTPLLPEIRERVNNPAYSVEGVASEGWIRGGIPSRELTRDKDYFRSHTENQYV